jgi:hypothetical protein
MAMGDRQPVKNSKQAEAKVKAEGRREDALEEMIVTSLLRPEPQPQPQPGP